MDEDWVTYLNLSAPENDDSVDSDSSSVTDIHPKPIISKALQNPGQPITFASEQHLLDFISNLPTDLAQSPTKLGQRNTNFDAGRPTKFCVNCKTTITPFWRRVPNTIGERKHHCNACGLYLRAHKQNRPVELTAKQITEIVETPKIELECAKCKSMNTPLWRRGPNGETLCNACGLKSRKGRTHQKDASI